jgi:hypothetical protein
VVLRAMLFLCLSVSFSLRFSAKTVRIRSLNDPLAKVI